MNKDLDLIGFLGQGNSSYPKCSYPKSRIFDLMFGGFFLQPDYFWLMLFSEMIETGRGAGR